MKHIYKCPKCDIFTMSVKHSCGTDAISTKPVRYTQVSYGKYRREARREELKMKGLL